MRLRPAEIDLKSVKLTPEEGYVLSRFDGPVEADQIAALTGLPQDRVDEIVNHLLATGILVADAEQTPSMIPSVPPAVRSSAPPDESRVSEIMVPSAAALPDFGPDEPPPDAASSDDWAAGLPPGVAPLGDSEPPPSSELPPGVTSLSRSDLPPGEEAVDSSALPLGVASILPNDEAAAPASLEPSGLPPGVTPLPPQAPEISVAPKRPESSVAPARPEVSQPLNRPLTSLSPDVFHNVNLPETYERNLPPGAAEFGGQSSFPPPAPRTRASASASGRERAITTPEAPRARAAAAPDVPSAARLPEGLLPSLDGERVLPPGVPDIFGADDPKDEAAPTPSAAAPDLTRSIPPSGAPSARPSVFPGDADARKLYAERFRGLDSAERIQIANSAVEPELSALCFDPEPPVIAAVLSNSQAGLTHARLIGLYHRNGVGIEMVVRRGELFRDPQVQRNLLRNPQIPDSVLQRIAKNKPLRDLYKACIDRDYPENVRAKLRGELRKRFGSGSPDEKAELIMRTEGRVLHLLAGCTFDGKTTQILCGKSFNSAVLIQNLAKFSAAPPALLAKVVQQPFVARQPGLKNLLLRHPNMPGDVKRRV